MEYLTANEVARRLKVHPRTVKRWLNAGLLKGKLLSDRAGWRVSEEELRRFMDNGEQGTAAPPRTPKPAAEEPMP